MKTVVKKSRTQLGVILALGLLASLGVFLYVRELNYREYVASSAYGTRAYARAEHEYRRALRLNPFSHLFKGGLGLSLVGQKKYAEAEPLLREVVKKWPRDVFILNGLATVCLASSKLNEAEELSKRIIEVDPNSVYAYPHLTEIYRRRGDYEKAEEYGIKAIEAARYLPPEPKYLRNEPAKQFAVVLNEAGRYDEALAIVDQILKYDDHDVIALFEFAKIDEYLKEKQAALNNWALLLKAMTDYELPKPYSHQDYTLHRAFAQKRIEALEHGEPFLTPPSPQNRLNWGEIPKQQTKE